LLDTLTLSVLVAKTARDLKKSPRKLLLNPYSAVLILLLRVVLPVLAATFLTDLWFEIPAPVCLQLRLTMLQVWCCRHSIGDIRIGFRGCQ
jgi:hypothetical protein